MSRLHDAYYSCHLNNSVPSVTLIGSSLLLSPAEAGRVNQVIVSSLEAVSSTQYRGSLAHPLPCSREGGDAAPPLGTGLEAPAGSANCVRAG